MRELFCYFCSDSEVSGVNHCEKGFSTYDDRCYTYIDERRTWSEAGQYCMDVVDGSLSSVRSEKQQDFLLDMSAGYTGEKSKTFLQLSPPYVVYLIEHLDCLILLRVW